jgi:hypothetical protein
VPLGRRERGGSERLAADGIPARDVRVWRSSWSGLGACRSSGPEGDHAHDEQRQQTSGSPDGASILHRLSFPSGVERVTIHAVFDRPGCATASGR